MTKFIVVADTSRSLYAIKITLFGIFNTYKEALDYVLKDETNYIVDKPNYLHDYDDENCDNQELFSFFEHYEGEAISLEISKEQYANKFIKEFVDKNPINLGEYYE